ncbi:hypothetical protein VCRA2123E130_430002 [Vibrio crassostreae]|nr:hypothetical protein VCRA2123E130_430002 [Vibrio crassostreae]
MNKNLDKFDNFDIQDENENENYESTLIDLSDESLKKTEEPKPTLYTMSASTIDIVEKYADIDEMGLGDVVRAAVYLLNNSKEEQRNEAYQATQVVKKKRGRKKGYSPKAAKK